ncbi:ABC transporter permease [Erwinia endophytica]|uniref:ABC transporter permease n=1 Tax=Erwinia endophytica TaxID=1563158 RepID=UPI001265FF09|nr:ABC transporter permease [Erwinia endophytica]KAB8307363.1 ABC transporter permease [Erwinia endophytica]
MSLLKNTPGLDDLVGAMKSFHVIRVMGGQDIRQRYKRSRLGPFWITISMAVMITTMGLVFGNLFKTPLHDFLPYLTLGLIIWGFLLSCITEGCDSLISAEGIIKQLPVPLHVHVLRVVWKNFIIFMHNIVIFPLVLLAVGKGVDWHVVLAIPGFILLALNISWMLVVMSLICARFRDMTQIILSIMQVIFYLTPVIWMPQLLTHRIGTVLLDFNPFYHFINVVRSPLLGQAPSVTTWIVTIVMAIIGVVFSTIMTGKFKYRVPYWV